MEESLQKNKSKKAYQLVKELTSSKQGRTTTIQDKAGKCLTEEQDILKRYTHTTTGDPKVLNVPPPVNNDSYPILREEVEATVKSLEKGKSAGVDNIPSELVQAGGKAMIDMLLIICNEIWQTWVANTLDSARDHHSPKERQPNTMPKLPYHQPDQSSK